MSRPGTGNRAAVQASVRAHYYRTPSPALRPGAFLWTPPQLAEVLTPEGVTAVDLASLLAVALDAYAKQKTADLIADDVEQRAPRFTGLRDHLRTGPGQADAVGWLIAVIIPVLVAVLSALLKPPTVIDVHVDEPPVVVQPVPSREEIERVVEEKLRELQHDRTSEPHQNSEGGRATHVPHDPAHDGQ